MEIILQVRLLYMSTQHTLDNRMHHIKYRNIVKIYLSVGVQTIAKPRVADLTNFQDQQNNYPKNIFSFISIIL